jgi:hypothetical protein
MISGIRILTLVVVLGFAQVAFAQTVLQSVVVQVKPGELDNYMDRIAKLQVVMTRLGGSSDMRVWQATLAGPNTGNLLVAIAHPSLAAYAETTAKVAADKEWQKQMKGLDDMRTLVSSSLITSRDGKGVPEAVAEGSVLQGVAVRVEPGKLDDYVAKIASLEKIRARLGASSGMRVWQATLAGANTGTVFVGIQHASLSAYAENAGKLRADPEAGKLLDGLDDIRTIESASLYRYVGP